MNVCTYCVFFIFISSTSVAAAPVVIDVASWHELCERLGPHPLDSNTRDWIRQLLGASAAQLYQSLHNNILPLSKNVRNGDGIELVK